MSTHAELRPADDGQDWFGQSLSLRLLREEQRELIPLLTQHIGVRGLFLRPHATVASELSGNMLQSVASVHREGSGFSGDLSFSERHLPFGSDSLNLIYALHALECSAAPLDLLAECARTLAPDGSLFVLGLSPFSAWRLRWRRAIPRVFSPSKLRRVLDVLGLSVELHCGVGPIWPAVSDVATLRQGPASGRSALEPLRAGFLLLARKRRSTLTPIGRRVRRMALSPQARPG